AGAAVLNAGTARADHEAHKHDEHIKTIGECAKICNEAAHHCLTHLKHGENAEKHAKAHEATMDCQAFCVLTATLTARSSPMARYAHEACANACRDCASACEGHEDQIMKECVEACRKCEQMCRQMSAKSA
ncbi:MAG: four-helix bundle copper-binding protein, partial [Isosphaeraceae bacterium]